MKNDQKIIVYLHADVLEDGSRIAFVVPSEAAVLHDHRVDLVLVVAHFFGILKMSISILLKSRMYRFYYVFIVIFAFLQVF
jgi:hypothetical protein